MISRQRGSMTPSVRRRAESLFKRNVPLRVLVYYLVLADAFFALWRYGPHGRPTAAPWLAAPFGGAGAVRPTAETVTSGQLGAMAAYGMVVAVLLTIPVAWIYTLTRQKRGYRQSVVQTLVILPAVAGAILVVGEETLAPALPPPRLVAA